MTGPVIVDHIVWDWNGTLFGDNRALIDSTIDAFDAVGLPPVTRAEYQRHFTQPIPVFYDRLAGRTLTATEQSMLDRHFQESYARRRGSIELTHDAADALESWKQSGGGQSLLSMHPHERLVPLVRKMGIFDYFAEVDGLVGTQAGRKAPHLDRHLAKLGVSPDRVLMIGDSADDAVAAEACGVACMLYHPGEDALHELDHLRDMSVPVADSLLGAVADLLAVRSADSDCFVR
uniref:Phosphatase n=1 Tax=Streptomyces citricolor TaxID=212427 RepID=A0A1B4ZC99_9ACTN|nr:phosphatase [Streptomyces citricolor]BAV57069.1 phosphatase [Streptomyces citricolor]